MSRLQRHLFALALLTAAVPARAAWPHLRGPACDGVSAENGLADTWPEGGPPLLFLAACYGYYELCVAVGYVVAWSFLAGFLPAAPTAVVAARSRRWWLWLPAEGVGFAVYFWASALLPGWKDQWGG